MSIRTLADCINLTDDDKGPENDEETEEAFLCCPLCSDCRNVTENELKDHMWKHSDIICDLNDDVNSSGVSTPPVTINPPVRKPSASKSFMCYVCQANFVTVDDLRKHLQVHARMRVTNPTPTPVFLPPQRVVRKLPSSQFKCPKCSMTFNKLPYLKRHIRTHVENRNFVCPICNYRCARAHNLKLHMRLHEQLS